jgi:hypothetical protein
VVFPKPRLLAVNTIYYFKLITSLGSCLHFQENSKALKHVLFWYLMNKLSIFEVLVIASQRAWVGISKSVIYSYNSVYIFLHCRPSFVLTKLRHSRFLENIPYIWWCSPYMLVSPVHVYIQCAYINYLVDIYAMPRLYVAYTQYIP